MKVYTVSQQLNINLFTMAWQKQLLVPYPTCLRPPKFETSLLNITNFKPLTQPNLHTHSNNYCYTFSVIQTSTKDELN